jgi:hypothetical protein
LKYKLEFKKALARNDLFGTSYMEILDDWKEDTKKRDNIRCV